jgi:hypothetical protein
MVLNGLAHLVGAVTVDAFILKKRVNDGVHDSYGPPSLMAEDLESTFTGLLIYDRENPFESSDASVCTLIATALPYC